MYVTLEPCAHHGVTPPCADAVVEAGIARVVCAVGDPNPRTDGRGFERLRDAGIEVELAGGELEWRARVQNEGFRTWASLGRPFVTYKAASTLDGKVAAASGDSRWVSGEASRRLVHELRAVSHAVAVGMGTVRRESPELTARDVGAVTQPRRLAFGHGPLPEGSTLELRSGPLEEELRLLAADGVQTLLLEGGPTLAGAFLRAGLIDRLLVFVAPRLVGGDDAPGLFGGPAVSSIADAVPLRRLEARAVGEDVLLGAYLREP
jgi:diaminohydroxyphosphoribosylaminopyrimidine deaminase/5-amino-6-(5-phosphoribosylamino)uracil reductase